MSVDPGLLSTLRNLARTLGIAELSETDAAHVTRSAQDAFVTKPEATWWWTVLRPPVASLRYGEKDGLTLLLRLVPSETTVVLVVTDDEHTPWPAFEGSLREVVTMLREARVFEFWIVTRDWRWIVFDTHNNELVVSGSLVTLAQAIVAPPLDG